MEVFTMIMHCYASVSSLLLMLQIATSPYSASAQSSTSRYHDEASHVASEDGQTWKMTRDPNYCYAARSKCYTTGQCCPGFLCSTINGYTHSSDEHPGECVKVPEPDKCSTNDECVNGQECITSGRLRYCQPASVSGTIDPNHTEGLAHDAYQLHHRGGLGSSCDNNTQCLPFTADGADRLCCQDVKRGRQGTKRMCDRITQLSLCINVQQDKQ